MSDDTVTPDLDKGEVLSIWATLAAMNDLAELKKLKGVDCD